MNRPVLIIASPDPAIIAAWQQALQLFLPQSSVPHQIRTACSACMNDLIGVLDSLGPDQLRECVVICDLSANHTNPWQVRNMSHGSGYAAELVLSYPEVYFVFVGTPRTKAAFEDHCRAAQQLGELVLDYHFLESHSLPEALQLVIRHAQGFRTLFDPTGLRALLKQQLPTRAGEDESKAEAETSRPNLYEPLWASRLANVAAIADEESAFVYLNGYVAYAAGYRAWLLSTKAEFLHCFGRQARAHPPARHAPEKFDLLLSDWDLVYPDETDRQNVESLLLSNLIDLKRDEPVILVTGVESPQQKTFLDRQKGFRESKPYGGIFDLLLACPSKSPNPLKLRHSVCDRGDPHHLYWTYPRRITLWCVGVWQQWWPRQLAPVAANHPPHSAPYARTAVAARLLLRATRMAAIDRGSTDARIHMAVLANDAKEVLSGLSRTTAYEALALQHEAEVLAEVSFMGSVAQIDVETRLNLLEHEAARIQQATNEVNPLTRPAGRQALQNCLAQTTTQLRLVFIKYAQVEAAESCLRRMAGYRSGLTPWGNPLNWFTHLFTGYANLVTRAGTSFASLFFTSVLYVIAFGLVYASLLLAYPTALPPQSGALSAADVAGAVGMASVPPAGLLAAPVLLMPLTAEPTTRKPHQSFSDVDAIMNGLFQSAFTFTQLESERFDDLKTNSTKPLTRWLTIYRGVILIETCIAYLHLGLLVAVIYRKLTYQSQ